MKRGHQACLVQGYEGIPFPTRGTVLIRERECTFEMVNLKNKTCNKVNRKTGKFALFARIEARKIKRMEKEGIVFFTRYC